MVTGDYYPPITQEIVLLLHSKTRNLSVTATYHMLHELYVFSSGILAGVVLHFYFTVYREKEKALNDRNVSKADDIYLQDAENSIQSEDIFEPKIPLKYDVYMHEIFDAGKSSFSSRIFSFSH